MLRVRAVAFDMEGTVVNVEPAHHGGWLKAAEEIGVRFDSVEEAVEVVPHFSGGPDRPIIEEIYALLPGNPKPTDEQVAAFLARKWVHYDELVRTLDLRPRPGFFEVYGKLKCAGIPMTIGTAVELEKGLALLKASGLAKLFLLHEIVLLTDVEHPKPAPDCFVETARRVGVHPHEQLVFEDSPRGVQSGVAAGSPVVGIPVYGSDTVRDRLLKAGANVVYPDWRDINVDTLLRMFD